jgi:hypothetical protein
MMMTGGIPESAREPSPVYPAGRVGTPADPNIPRGGGSEFVNHPEMNLKLLTHSM